MEQLLKTFDQSAACYDKVALIPQKIALELLDRLSIFHYFKPNTILDVGCGTGNCLYLFKKAYPNAQCFGLDISRAQLQKAKKKTYPWFGARPSLILGDIEKIQFTDQQFELICANLSLLWVQDFRKCLLKLQKLLKPNGLLLFTMFGPDHFKTLSSYKIEPNLKSYPCASFELHNLGDLLVQSQFSDVVIDVNYFDVNYPNLQVAYQNLQDMGFASLFSHTNALHEKHLSSTAAPMQMTWEVIYAQAWRLPNNAQKAFSNSNIREIAIPINQLHKQ